MCHCPPSAGGKGKYEYLPAGVEELASVITETESKILLLFFSTAFSFLTDILGLLF